MRIVVDAREAFGTKKTGKGQWVSGLISALRAKGTEMTLLVDSSCHEADVVRLPSGAQWHTAAVRYLRNSREQCCYLSTTSFIVPALLPRSIPVVQIVHDLIAFHQGRHDLKAKVLERMLFPRVAKSCRHFCAISEATKKDLCTMFPAIDPSRVSVVYAGPMEQNPSPNQPDSETILCVGTLCPRKNQLRLIRAYASLPSSLRERYKLLIAGNRGWSDSEIVRMAKNTKGVQWIGYVSDDRYKELLASCTIFALPSLYEGFGMQILDALQRGIPVLTSDRGSLKEVAGDAAVLVDPESDRSIASGLVAILEDEDVRQELAKRGPVQAGKFSWKRTADLVLSAVESAV
ncbi:glycosyltransferase family 4 protein [Candidatus Peregrinibacteria bacterium]|nr:glycosyltransferase family 4 protein [Candidatus Peregrinibacteria bacterium]